MPAPAPARSRWSLIALAAALILGGCDDDRSTFAPTGPDLAASRAVDLGQCTTLAAPAGSELVLHVWAEGAQIYQWNGTAWVFQGPSATLYANAGRTGKIGTHYTGPTWESNSGGLVVGRLNKPCEVGSADIPWLLLDAVRTEGPGIFHDVTAIQRVNTTGGRAPATPGSLGEVRNVPYTAEYYFYRAP
jgi:hypothetical protein